ncbi:MAG: hypothetical protein QXP36_10600 [Conexivisphaerales archaeon]
MTVLISFTMEYRGRSRADISRFYREIYGYTSHSYYGRYISRKEGFLDGIKHVRYSKGLFMIRREDERKVLTFRKRKGAKVSGWEVVPKREELWSLGLRTD